jgi:ATP-dependent Clp protease ATP-binding subunit ClpC
MIALFSGDARKAMMQARDEANRLGSEVIGVEHIMLAILSDDSWGAHRLLAHLGAPVWKVRKEIERAAPKGGDPPAGQLPISQDAKDLIEAAARVVGELKHEAISTSHLLLADLSWLGGVLTRALPRFGCDPADFHRRILELARGRS